ncbi:MAG TPA: M23 family metallopeptidase [Candidatus Cloacimonadota bacterium]|nr:M23 family metallopeptidase [Candidatus Cloacimonadota bacterium]
MDQDFLPPNRLKLTFQLGMDSRQHSLSLPKWVLVVVCALLLVFLVSTFIMIFSLSGIKSRDTQITKLKAENTELRAKMESTLGSITARVDSISAIIGDNPADSLKGKDYPYYSGKFDNHKSKYINSVEKRLDIIETRLEYILSELGTLPGSSPDQGRLSHQTGSLIGAPSIYPAFGNISDDYGMRIDPFSSELAFHHGVDISNEVGTPIYATADGVIVSTKYEPGYGKYILIDHENGYETIYGHMAGFKVRTGDRVHKGQIIGVMGSTGQSTGPHVHYEVRIGNTKVNPGSFFNRIDSYEISEG